MSETESPTPRLCWPLPGEDIIFFPDQAERWEGLDPTENLYFDQGIEESGGNIFIKANTLNEGVAIQRINRAHAEEWLLNQGYVSHNASDGDFDPGAWEKP